MSFEKNPKNPALTPEVPATDPLWKDKNFVLGQIQKDSRQFQFASPELQQDEDIFIGLANRAITGASVDEIKALGLLVPDGWTQAGPKIKEFFREHKTELENAFEVLSGLI